MDNEKKITLKLEVKGLKKFAEAKEKLGEGLQSTTKATKEMNGHLGKANKNMSKIVALTKRASFYRVIGLAFRAMSTSIKDGTTNLYEYSRALNSMDSAKAFNTLNEYKSIILQVKNTIGAGLAPILQSLLPIVQKLTNAFIALFNAVNALFHIFRGESSFTRATKISADQMASANKSAKELKKTIFGFDELNVLNAPNNGSGGAASVDYSKMFEEVDMTDEFKQKLKDKLQDTERMIGGYALLLGTVLAFTGKIPLGIGLMAAGAVAIAASSGINWNFLGDTLGEKLSNITEIVSGAMLAVGAVMTLSGANVPLGIGLMLAGLAGQVASSLNWTSLENSISSNIATITNIVSLSAIAVGAILALSGINTPLGISMMAAGFVGLYASMAINDKISGIIKGVLGTILAIAGGASLALGLILLCCPGTLELGLALVFAGLIGASAGYSLTSNPIVDFVVGMINGIVLAFQDGINDIIRLINAVTKELNAIPGINIPQIREFKATLIGTYEEKKGARQDLQPRAAGGMVTPGSMFLAGERGAELITATSNGVNVSTRDQIAASVASGNESVVNALFAVANTLVNTINSQDYGSDVYIGDRDIVRAYDRGKRLMGNSLVEV